MIQLLLGLTYFQWTAPGKYYLALSVREQKLFL